MPSRRQRLAEPRRELGLWLSEATPLLHGDLARFDFAGRPELVEG